MMILTAFPGSEPMTDVRGNRVNNNSCPEDFLYYRKPVDSTGIAARNNKIIPGSTTATDTLTVDYRKHRDEWYWFIGINLYPK